MKQVSIIIVTYNSERDIYDCIDSIKLCADIPLSDIELIIVDNNSLNYETMFMRLKSQWEYDIVLIENTHNGGYGQGNNVGICRATAPIILVMNPDVRLITPFFFNPLKAFTNNPKLVMYGMKQMQAASIPSNNSFWWTTMSNGYLRVIATSICNRLNFYLPRWMYFSGSCFFIRKKMFEAVGLFDESVFMYGEECDIHYRLLHKYGPYFHFDKTLKYLHLTRGRKFNSDFEINVINIDLQQHFKKGYPALKTLRNYKQIHSINLFRQNIYKLLGRSDEEYIESLKNVIAFINEKIKEEKK